MRKSVARVVRALIVTLAAVLSCSWISTVVMIAQPAPVPSLDRWLNESDLIVVGRIVQISETEAAGAANGHHENAASIQSDRILKGHLDDQILTICYQNYPRAEEANVVLPNRYSLSRNQYGMLFLRSRGKGIYVFADPYQGLVPVTSRRIQLAETASTAKEKVEAELFASLSDTDPQVAEATMTQVRRSGAEQFIAPLHAIAASTDPDSQGMAFAALIKLGDYSLLGPAIEYSEKPPIDPNAQYWKARITDAISYIGTHQIRKALEAGGDKRSAYCPSKIPLDRSVPAHLDSLLSSEHIDLRRAAAHALRGICDPFSARFLASALDNSDRNVQYDAMMGLAALEDFPADRPAPPRKSFDQSPAKYLDIWESWWKDSGGRKYSARD